MTNQHETADQDEHRRPSTADMVLAEIAVLGIELNLMSLPFVESMDWSFNEPQHKVFLQRSGTARSKEVEFQRGPSGVVTPRESNVWVIPAEQSAAALISHARGEFAMLTLPTATLGDNTLRPLVGRQDPLLRQLVERIADVADRDDVIARLLRESLTDGLRLHIRDRYGERSQLPRRPARTLGPVEQQRVVDFLHDGLDAEIDLPTLAGLVGMGVHTFSRAFSATFHTTPYQFVLDRRIARSKHLLATTPLSVTEISDAVGFSNPSHFATTFKQRVGVTPSAFRRNARA